jgi:PAS domain S-box-containing protein
MLEFPWLTHRLAVYEVTSVRSPEDLPAEAFAEHREMLARGTKSLLVIPMVFGKSLLGFILVESLSASRSWSSDSIVLIQLFAQILANAYERKRVEEELLESRERFLLNAAQLQLRFNNTNSGMATCTTKGRFLSINEALCKLLGYGSEELFARTLSELTHLEDRQIPHRKMRELLKRQKPSIELERRMLHKDGSIVHTVTRLGAVFDSRNQLQYIAVEIDDVSERKKWEEDYVRACKLESLGVLAGGIAHDFNNILMAILGSVSCLRIEGEPSTAGSPATKYRSRISDIETAVLRAKDLTQQLLTFSKGGAPIKRTTSVVEIIEDTIGFTLSGSPVRSFLEIDPDIWSVEADPGQISQVVNNVILNASQAMPEGGNIRVRCENVQISNPEDEDSLPTLRPGRYVRITFTDDGCGIAPEHLSKVFDPFFTTKSDGSGLGLATTYSIITKHRGQISIESKVNTGTTITVHLPASPRGAKVEPREGREIYSGSGKILIMDDELQVRSAAGEMLRHLGYDVDFAVNGEEAVELYRRARFGAQPYSAVIMDLTIRGGMGGVSTIRALKGIDPEIKAIVSSGYADGSVMAEYKTHGFQGVMAKPYELSTLSHVLHDVITKDPHLL